MQEYRLRFYFRDKLVYNQFGEGEIVFPSLNKATATKFASTLIAEDNECIPEVWDYWKIIVPTEELS